MLYAYDELSRGHIEDLRREAAQANRARSVASARRWTALARWAGRHAQRAAERVT